MPSYLDARRIAMLAEMGIRVFQPAAFVEPKTPVSPTFSWRELEETLATCKSCGPFSQSPPSLGEGDREADWLVVGDHPSATGSPFDGDEMILLTNMLRAVSTSTAKGAYVTSLVKCRKAKGRNPTRTEVEACIAHLEQEIAAIKPKVVLMVGALAAPAILDSQLPSRRLRCSVHHKFGTALVVTYSPGFLLRNPEHKAGAWADLCLALPVFDGGD